MQLQVAMQSVLQIFVNKFSAENAKTKQASIALDIITVKIRLPRCDAAKMNSISSDLKLIENASTKQGSG